MTISQEREDEPAACLAAVALAHDFGDQGDGEQQGGQNNKTHHQTHDQHDNGFDQRDLAKEAP